MKISFDQKNARPWQNHYGPSTAKEIPEIRHKNLVHMISEANEKWASHKAFTISLPNGLEGTLRYSDVQELSDAFAVYLREKLGLLPGDRVAIQLPNCLAYPVAAFGAMKAGCIVVNTNPLYTPYEMVHQFNDSGAKAVIIADLFADKLTTVLPTTTVQHVVSVSIAEFFSFPKKILIQTMMKYVSKQIPKCDVPYDTMDSAIAQGKTLKRQKKIDVKKYWADIPLENICILQYTGGTTGVSKGAMLTHKNLLANSYQVQEIGRAKLDPGHEITFSVLPLYHIFAFTVKLLVLHVIGTHNILIPNPRPITNLKPAFKKYKITWMVGVNTLFNALNNEDWFKKNPPKSIKLTVSGGTALHRAVGKRWGELTESPIYEGFGLTETSPVVCFNPVGGQIKEETVGVPAPSTDLVLLDESGNPLPLDDENACGEIAVKGPQVMLGYWNHPKETEMVFKDGWLLTGDIGKIDKDGYVKIVDRKKDMILVSGFNVYPNEIEDCIAKLQSVAEVAVIGVPYESTGETVKAYIVKKPQSILTEDEVIKHCKNYMTGYKVPKIIEFRSELPKSPVGKVLRKELKAEARKAGSICLAPLPHKCGSL